MVSCMEPKVRRHFHAETDDKPGAPHEKPGKLHRLFSVTSLKESHRPLPHAEPQRAARSSTTNLRGCVSKTQSESISLWDSLMFGRLYLYFNR